MTDLQDLLWITDLDRSGLLDLLGTLTKKIFLQTVILLILLKLRASLGETGNNSVGLNSYQSLFGYGGSYDDNGAVSPSFIWKRYFNLGKTSSI